MREGALQDEHGVGDALVARLTQHGAEWRHGGALVVDALLQQRAVVAVQQVAHHLRLLALLRGEAVVRKLAIRGL